MNIGLIEATGSELQLFEKFNMPRLGLIMIGTMLKKLGHTVRIFIQELKKPKSVDWDWLDQADVIGISVITPTASEGYQIALRFKGKIPVVMGGPHPTFLPEEALNYCDYVVRGEGEETFLDLIEKLDNKKEIFLRNVLGISYVSETGRFIHNPSRPLIKNLDDLPIPDFGLIHRGWRWPKYPISLSRGCPFHCNFCSAPKCSGINTAVNPSRQA